jgi:2-methylcitrate dehydratase PrpD
MQAESELADFCVGIRADDIPDEARKRAVDALTDCVACALAGATQPLARSVLQTIYTAPECPGVLIGAAQRAPAPDAALYNGAIAHALDYDDISHPAYSHPSAVLLPALLSCADDADVTGRAAVTAYVIGIEVFGKLGRALNLKHYKNGWHATSTFGAIAASVAVGSLLRLSKRQLLNAIGLAAAASSGLRCNFGTMAKPLHAGYAARNGVLAALLARNGCDASEDALTHKYGFFSTFNGGAGISQEQFSGWGAPFEILTESGIGLKLYPSCAATHPAIEAAEKHRRALDGKVDAIRKVRVGMSEFATEPLIYVVPETPLQAKFSMHYCVAAALTREHVTLKTFSIDAINDPRTLALMGKIETYIDERVRDDHEFAAVVRVDTPDGRTREELVRVAPGKPQRWFTRDQLERKFMDCCLENKGVRDAPRVFELVQAIDSPRPLSELAVALSQSA